MNKTEIQDRIDALQADFDSKLASLKADLAKCDCADGIEQEKCWHVVDPTGVCDVYAKTKDEACKWGSRTRPAYMPECRQVTAEDVGRIPCFIPVPHVEIARELHKLGFRIKVTP